MGRTNKTNIYKNQTNYVNNQKFSTWKKYIKRVFRNISKKLCREFKTSSMFCLCYFEVWSFVLIWHLGHEFAEISNKLFQLFLKLSECNTLYKTKTVHLYTYHKRAAAQLLLRFSTGWCHTLKKKKSASGNMNSNMLSETFAIT